ncbi:Cysteine-rich receptor-like protein kinase 41 [Forsythia ovata]|uniref:Cysteine-rich receptor-like protein kinase 41 n=1 Tax=Forsythia ovata TaxID=205694 RepID=A0ABD1UDA7_9LAMI
MQSARLDPSSVSQLMRTLIMFQNILKLMRICIGLIGKTIAAATNNFSPSNKIGIGEFSSVYKCILSTGQEVAVKRSILKHQRVLAELKNEVLLISKLQHPNVIKLLGYCCHQEEIILVYEFMENKSLDAHIFDESRRRELGWTIRMKIIISIARCLVYLHQDSGLRICHRYVTPSSILLDYEMKPKISSFGLARSFEEHQTIQTETSTLIVGAIVGYASPEYLMHGVLSLKSDVFSFGVVVLEILIGRKINGPFQLLDDQPFPLLGLEHAWKMWNEGKALDLLDKSIEDEFSADKALSCIQVGLLCVQERADDRPTMRSVLDMLEGEGVKLPQPKRPAFVSESGSEYSHTDSKNELSLQIRTYEL